MFQLQYRQTSKWWSLPTSGNMNSRHMNNSFVRWFVHIIGNAALQALILETIHTEPWLHVTQIVFLVGGLSLAYFDQGPVASK